MARNGRPSFSSARGSRSLKTDARISLRLFDLLQPLLRLCVGFLLALGAIGFRLAGSIGPNQSPGRARDAADAARRKMIEAASTAPLFRRTNLLRR